MVQSKSEDSEKAEVRYLDGGWGWVVMVASFLSQTVIGSVYFGYGVLLVEWMDEFQSSSAITSLVGSTVAGVISASGPLASWMILKTSCRTTHILGGAILAVSAIACSFATSIVQIFIFYSIVAGIGGSLCYITSVVILSEYFKQKRSIAVGIALGGIGFGSFVFPVIYEYLIECYGWRGLMLISCGINAHMIAFGMIMCPVPKAPMLSCGSTTDHGEVKMADSKYLDRRKVSRGRNEPTRTHRRNSIAQLFRAFIRNPRARRKSSVAAMMRDDAGARSQFLHEAEDGRVDLNRSDDELQDTDVIIAKTRDGTDETAYRTQLFKLLKMPLFYVVLLNNITLLFGMMIAFALTSLRAVTDNSMTTKQGALLVSITGLANLIGRILWGVIASCEKVNTTILFLALGMASGILVLSSNLAHSFGISAINCAMTGLAFGNLSIYPVVLGDLFGDRLLTIVFGALEVANGIGGVLGPLFGGFLYDVTGTYQYSFVASGVAMLIGVVPFGFLFLCKTIRVRKPSC